MNSSLIKYYAGPPFSNFIKLYPNVFEQFVFLVPNRIITKPHQFDIYQTSMLISIWFIPIILYSILRYKNQRIFGMSALSYSNKFDRILVVFLSIFFLLASSLFSGFLFQLYTSDLSHHEIDSIEDLAKSDLEIHYPVDNIDPENWLRNKYWLAFFC